MTKTREMCDDTQCVARNTEHYHETGPLVLTDVRFEITESGKGYEIIILPPTETVAV